MRRFFSFRRAGLVCAMLSCLLFCLALQVQAEPGESAQGQTPEAALKAKEKEAADKTREALKAKEAREAELKQRQEEATEKKRREVARISEDDPLKDIWAGQRTMVTAVIAEAERLSETFLTDTSILDKIRPVEQDIRRLLLMLSEFRQWPSPLEAVNRRLGISLDLVRSLLLQAEVPQVNAKKLLEQLDASAENMTDFTASHHDETTEYINRINTARFLLAAVITRYATALAPARSLIDRVAETRADISRQLPLLWTSYYTQPPVAWLSLDEWANVPHNLSYFGMGLSLRRYVELPITSSQWQGAVTRFAISLLALGALSLLMVNTLLHPFPEILSHTKRCSLPWNVLGVALIAASVPPTMEPFRLFMAIGNICLIRGQIAMAWDLRRVKHPDVQRRYSPLLALLPLTFCAYLFIYLPLPRLVTLVLWLVSLLVSLWWCRKKSHRDLDIGSMQMEKSIMDLQPLILWPCLILCLLGLHFYSMALYLLYSSVSVAVQISAASLSFISKLNESLTSDDARTMLASFILALAAPIVLLFSLTIVSLWLATLPGGMDLLQFYIFKSVSIGETQLNFVQLLLIATAFFLARTAARMGQSFINRLPERGFRVDSSLVTPLQTAYFYAVWCLFGFFVLRSLGMNLSNLAVIAGGLSVGIGFGMQNLVNNFVSGIILIFSRSLQVGDIVQAGDIVGRIKRINVRSTLVETPDSATIYVPNSTFISGNLTNWTSSSRSRRQQVEVGVAYGSDTQLVSKTLLDIANRNTDILAFPQPSVQFREFGASTLNFALLFWVKDYDLAQRVASELRFAINRRFAEEHIEIAFPQMDVHLRQGASAAPLGKAAKAARQAGRARALRRPAQKRVIASRQTQSRKS